MALLEAACERALAVGAASYKRVKSILAHALDAQPLPAASVESRPGPDGRGSAQLKRDPMLLLRIFRLPAE